MFLLLSGKYKGKLWEDITINSSKWKKYNKKADDAKCWPGWSAPGLTCIIYSSLKWHNHMEKCFGSVWKTKHTSIFPPRNASLRLPSTEEKSFFKVHKNNCMEIFMSIITHISPKLEKTQMTKSRYLQLCHDCPLYWSSQHLKDSIDSKRFLDFRDVKM
mgnify:CR=1 FL=1